MAKHPKTAIDPQEYLKGIKITIKDRRGKRLPPAIARDSKGKRLRLAKDLADCNSRPSVYVPRPMGH